jgi:hypothetical protein
MSPYSLDHISLRSYVLLSSTRPPFVRASEAISSPQQRTSISEDPHTQIRSNAIRFSVFRRRRASLLTNALHPRHPRGRQELHTLYLLSPSLVVSKIISERTTARSFRFVEIMGFEPTTYGLQSRRSSQLSYIPS